MFEYEKSHNSFDVSKEDEFIEIVNKSLQSHSLSLLDSHKETIR